MAKSPKKSKEAAAPDIVSSGPANTASANSAANKPVKLAAGKRRATKPAKLAGKRANNTPDKTAASRKQRPSTAAKKTRSPGHLSISDDEVRIRAYFISERRLLSGVPGDSAHDWLEACRQLQEEAAKSS